MEKILMLRQPNLHKWSNHLGILSCIHASDAASDLLFCLILLKFANFEQSIHSTWTKLAQVNHLRIPSCIHASDAASNLLFPLDWFCLKLQILSKVYAVHEPNLHIRCILGQTFIFWTWPTFSAWVILLKIANIKQSIHST